MKKSWHKKFIFMHENAIPMHENDIFVHALSYSSTLTFSQLSPQVWHLLSRQVQIWWLFQLEYSETNQTNSFYLLDTLLRTSISDRLNFFQHFFTNTNKKTKTFSNVVGKCAQMYAKMFEFVCLSRMLFHSLLSLTCNCFLLEWDYSRMSIWLHCKNCQRSTCITLFREYSQLWRNPMPY